MAYTFKTLVINRTYMQAYVLYLFTKLGPHEPGKFGQPANIDPHE